MVGGHTKQESLYEREGEAILNGGRITFPRRRELRLGGEGLLELEPGSLHAEVIPIGETPGPPNPLGCVNIGLEAQ